MSNYLAIATVTNALKGLLTKNTPPDVRIIVGRPTATLGNGEPLPGANIFLFQVTPNAALSNNHVPTRRTDGSLAQRPQSALVLHYLISVWGSGVDDDRDLNAQNVLAAVVRKLNAQPLLTRKNIEDSIVKDGAVSSNLADEVEQVKFTMKTLSLEDLSKLWSIFFQTPYFLSVAYEASVVFIEPDETPRQALPVLERNVYVRPFQDPVIDGIVPIGGTTFDPILDQAKISIRGSNLKGDSTSLLIDGTELAPDSVSSTEIQATLPPTLYSGLHALQISQKIKMGKKGKETDHLGVESRLATFVLAPKIVGSGPGKPTITINTKPKVKKGQRVVLLLNDVNLSKAYSLPAQSTPAPVPNEIDPTVFGTAGVDAGTYVMRIQVDGAESRLGVDATTGLFNSPTIVIP